jgi:hypothetical protein
METNRNGWKDSDFGEEDGQMDNRQQQFPRRVSGNGNGSTEHFQRMYRDTSPRLIRDHGTTRMMSTMSNNSERDYNFLNHSRSINMSSNYPQGPSSVYSDDFVVRNSHRQSSIYEKNIIVHQDGDSFEFIDKKEPSNRIQVHVITCGKKSYVRFNNHDVYDLSLISDIKHIQASRDNGNTAQSVNSSIANTITIDFEHHTSMQLEDCTPELFSEVLVRLGPYVETSVSQSHNEISQVIEAYRPSQNKMATRQRTVNNVHSRDGKETATGTLNRTSTLRTRSDTGHNKNMEKGKPEKKDSIWNRFRRSG